jgi:hypothetical protein
MVPTAASKNKTTMILTMVDMFIQGRKNNFSFYKIFYKNNFWKFLSWVFFTG